MGADAAEGVARALEWRRGEREGGREELEMWDHSLPGV